MVIQPQFLPVPIAEVEPGDVGLVNGYPIAVSLNRVMRWWRVKNWKLVMDLRFAATTEPVVTWRLKREIIFKNHTIQGYSLEEVPFELTNEDQLLFPRRTSYKASFPEGTVNGIGLNPKGNFTVRMFSEDPEESVKQVGTLYYPKFDFKLNIITTETPTILLELMPTPTQDVNVVMALDNIGITGLSTVSVDPEEVVWAGGKVSIEVVDYWY